MFGDSIAYSSGKLKGKSFSSSVPLTFSPCVILQDYVSVQKECGPNTFDVVIITLIGAV